MTSSKVQHQRARLILCLSVFFGATYLLSGHVNLSRDSSVDIRSILTETVLDTDFSLAEHPTKHAHVGLGLQRVEFDDRTIHDDRTGKPFVSNEGATFNLALSRLPYGSAWDYVGVARGPTFRNEFVKVSGQGIREQTIVGLGLNLGRDGKLIPVTTGRILDVPMIPNEACNKTGYPGTYGPEDPRVFWTDAGTIGLTFGRMASIPGICRDIGFIPDLRAVFPELSDAIKTGNGVTAYNGKAHAGEAHAGNRELIMGENQGFIEKNWISFFPGPKPDKASVFPHIHYKMAPDSSIRPSEISLRRVTYEFIDSKNDNCLAENHPHLGAHALHQATPLYRLTLCPRGCTPTQENTVYLALGHIRTPSPRYHKFFATYSTVEPFEPISVGPVVNFNGTDDEQAINYVMSLQPITKSTEDLRDNSKQSPYSTRGVLPDHFFIDDLVLASMGQSDARMTSIVLEMKEVLAGHRLCR